MDKNMRYRAKIKTPDGEIKIIGLERDGPADLEGIRKNIEFQQHTTNRRTGAFYMPTGDIMSVEVVKDSDPVPLVRPLNPDGTEGAPTDPRKIIR